MKRHRLGLISLLLIAFPAIAAAEDAEFARVARNGGTATLRVFGARPVDLAAKKLADEFGVAVNVEDPFYMNLQDLEEVKPPRVAASGSRMLVPKPSALEMRLELNSDGSLKEARTAVQDLADAANAKLPFLYRVDADGGVFTLVATRTRDDRGRSVELNPMFDRHVTVPLGTRTILEHVQLLAHALEEQTGLRIGCCETAARAMPWGSTVLSFEARDETARSAFLRLVRNEPAAAHAVHAEPGRYYWSMRCEPRDSGCFITVAPIR